MTKTTHTHRGTCQACGRQQAVENERRFVAKHGYTVDFGYFNGVCPGGKAEKPAEFDLTLTHATIVGCTKAAEGEERYIAALKAGKAWPETFERWNPTKDATVKTGWGERKRKGAYDTLPIAKATADERKNAVKESVFLHQRNAEGLRAHIAFLIANVLPRFGQPLTANPATTKRVYAKGMHFVYQPDVKGGTEYVLQYEAYSHGFGRARERLIGWYALAVKPTGNMSAKPVRFTTRELNQCNLKP